jgi:hypothetical protein
MRITSTGSKLEEHHIIAAHWTISPRVVICTYQFPHITFSLVAILIPPYAYFD